MKYLWCGSVCESSKNSDEIRKEVCGWLHRQPLAFITAVILCFFLYAPMLHAGQSARPCIRSSHECTEWVELGAGSAKSLIYTSYSLKAQNSSIKRALIMVHGARRNPNQAFATATAAAFLANAVEDTIVIAPGFSSAEKGCGDKLEKNEVNWTCRGDSWRSGSNSANFPELSSFDFADELVRLLSNKKMFPNLTQIVFAGHSAGGQFVSRYEMANRIHDIPGVKISYVVANPSSYAWPTETRVLPVLDGSPESGAVAWKDEEPHVNFEYGAVTVTKASTYDTWPYGLRGRTSGYTAKISDEQLRKQLVSRPTTYLVGQLDVFPLAQFDGSRSAMAQGPTRRARGEAFTKYIDRYLGGKSKLLIVSECGHNGRCMYTSDSVLPIIFPPVRSKP